MDLKAVLSLRMARTQQEIISTEEAATKGDHICGQLHENLYLGT